MTEVFAGGKDALELQSKPGGLFAKLIDPADIAQTIVWLLSDDSSQVNGVNLLVGDALP